MLVAAMTTSDDYWPMPETRRILCLAYPGFELLDLGGPAGVFEAVNTLTGSPCYATTVLSGASGPVRASCSVQVQTLAVDRVRLSERDTVLVLGGERAPVRAACADSQIIDWLRRAAARGARMGSVCAGSFLLGTAGVLEGRRATTHWSACQQLARAFPSVRVEADAIYINDAHVWTSAGVSTGIDMALAMVRVDHGVELMAQVAQYLVLFAHRPGGQSQFSPVLQAQAAGDGHFSTLIAWMADHLADAITIPHMAERAGMSERTLLRRFTATMGMSPSRFLDRLRLDAARDLLVNGLPVKHVTRAVGYRSEAAFRSAFVSRFGVTPAQYTRLHHIPSQAATIAPD
jgi:transcriptional regulator GlxA family with amidase domain